MPFWSENFGEDASLKDPKRNFRFTVEFQGIQAAQGGAKLWYAKTATKPSFAINAAEHKYLNHTFYYPGNVTWNDITVTMVDPVDPDMSATLSAIVEGSGYKPPGSSEERASISKAKSAASLGTVIITQLDSDGNPLETWTLWNSFLTEVKYGDSLEYGNDDLTELSVTIKYDWARLQVGKDQRAAAGSGAQSFFNA
tara:strand:+ start:1503 stop:2093 length:591 start_codon:yes stop_codon:yes gene_type:complete